MSCAPPLPAEGFVLAGGRSSRMSRDKALLLLNGRTLVEIALEKLRSLPLTVPPRIAGSRPDLEAYAPVLEDLHPACGPLSGIEAALEATAAQGNFFLPIDLPLLPPRLLAWMLERAALTGALATFPRINGRPQPLCAVYHRDALPRIRHALGEREYSVVRTFAPGRAQNGMDEIGAEAAAQLAAKAIDIFDLEMQASVRPEIHDFSPLPMFHWFLNCNSPGDLAALAAFAAVVPEHSQS